MQYFAIVEMRSSLAQVEFHNSEVKISGIERHLTLADAGKRFIVRSLRSLSFSSLAA